MKQFNRFVYEGFKIPEKDLDDLIMKTFSIVNDNVKNRLKNEKEIEQGNMHLEILSLLKKEWDDRSVLPEFVFRVTDNIFKMHKNKELSVQ